MDPESELEAKRAVELLNRLQSAEECIQRLEKLFDERPRPGPLDFKIPAAAAPSLDEPLPYSPRTRPRMPGAADWFRRFWAQASALARPLSRAPFWKLAGHILAGGAAGVSLAFLLWVALEQREFFFAMLRPGSAQKAQSHASPSPSLPAALEPSEPLPVVVKKEKKEEGASLGIKGLKGSGVALQQDQPVSTQDPAPLTHEDEAKKNEALKEVAFTEEVISSLAKAKNSQDIDKANQSLDRCRRLISEGNYEQAAKLARQTVEDLLVGGE